MTIAEGIASLEYQLAQRRRNLLDIQEKEATYIDPRSVSPDLEEAKRRTQVEIAQAEERLVELGLHRDILVSLPSLDPDGVQTPELCEKLNLRVEQEENLFNALSSLHNNGLIRMRSNQQTVMVWITHKGRKAVRDFGEQDSTEINPTPFLPIGEYYEFSWTLDKLDPQCKYIVQRQNVIEKIQRILEDPIDRRIVFLYGPPQVGKTFVLNRLKETLRDRYVPVFIHVNGWLSISELAKFLYELANRIQKETRYQIEPFPKGSELEATTEFFNFMDNLIQCARAEERLLLLMFDELEYLARQEVDERIFDYLANCIDTYSQQVSFVFAGSGQMLDLLKRRALAQVWKKGDSVHLDCFDRKISRDLVAALTVHCFELEPRALDQVIYLADGHPSLLKSVLAILVRHWRAELQEKKITEDDLGIVLDDICNELSPKLTDIWRRIPKQERKVLQIVADKNQKSFKINDVVTKDQTGLGSHLSQLVKRQILDYDPQSKLYTVRLGLLVESISCGILSASD